MKNKIVGKSIFLGIVVLFFIISINLITTSRASNYDVTNEEQFFDTSNPRNIPPVINNTYPEDGAIDIPTTGTPINAEIFDADGDDLWVEVWSNFTGDWVEYASYDVFMNCSYPPVCLMFVDCNGDGFWSIYELIMAMSREGWGFSGNWGFVHNSSVTSNWGMYRCRTTYYWSLNVTDNSTWTNETYHFTTEQANIYVDDDAPPGWYDWNHVKTIQEGVNKAWFGGYTVYVYNGTYYENVIVNKTINLVGEDRNNTIIDGNSSGDVVNVSADWVNISGFTIRNGAYGININSNNNTITSNSIISNNDDGLLIYDSNSNIITGNIISNNSAGIYLYTFTSRIKTSHNNFIIDNNITSNSIGISLYVSHSNIIIGNNISNNVIGIYLKYSRNNTITGNNISSNKGDGIFHYSSINTVITDNNINSNDNNGIEIKESNSNTITYNVINSNKEDGIYLEYSSNNNITDNTITSNNGSGIKLVSCHDNILSNNNCSSNAGYGISLKYASNCVIDRNTVNDNKAFYKPNTTGLVGYWKMDEASWNGTLGEVVDSSGYGNNGTAENGANTTAFGMFGRAGEFDGVDDYVDCGNDSSLSITNEITIGAWIYPKANPEASTIVGKWSDASGEKKAYVLMRGAGGSRKIRFIVSDDGNYNPSYDIHSNNDISKDKWTYIVGVYNGNNIMIYLDGKLDKTASGPLGIYNANEVPVQIGKYPGASWIFNGTIDEVMIYNRVLSSEEIENQFNQFKAVDGIHLEQSDFNLITNNSCLRNKDGISLSSSSDNNITGNSISNNWDYGIYIDEYSRSNIIMGNQITNNRDGIFLYSSSDNIIRGNTLTSNNNEGIFLYSSSDNTISSNSISNNRDGINLEYHNIRNIITGNNISSNNEDGIILNDSISNTIMDNIISDNYAGIDLWWSNFNAIKGNTISNNNYGIHLDTSSSNIITGNYITLNWGDGIYLDWHSNSNNITDNNISSNIWSGIILYDSSNNTITDNNISNNLEGGINFIESNFHNTIKGNTISSNNENGILLYTSDSNTITGNNISNNVIGIYLRSYANNNFIYHNNLIDNIQNAYDEGDNTWDDGKYGNYWSDYEEKYPNAKKKPLKGIWDTPYEIPGGSNKDMYPLINQWSKPYVFNVDEEQNSQANPVVSMNPKTTPKDNSITQISVNSLKSI